MIVSLKEITQKDYSETHEIEDSVKGISEKELSMINKSHPEDKIVEQPRVIRPPRPNMKQAKPPHQNYHSADFSHQTQAQILKNNFVVERRVIDDSSRSHKSENFLMEKSPLRNDKEKSGRKASVSFKENNSVKKNAVSFRSENSNFSQMDEFKNSALFQKMAKKIRTQAKRIVEIEGRVMESEKFRNHGSSVEQNLNSGRLIRDSLKDEINIFKKKNELLFEENYVLKQKIEILEKSLKKVKNTSLENFSGNQDKEAIFQKISHIETENIELREILKQECIKNEKLNSMVDLLKKISEEKLETAGFKGYGDMGRVETLLDAVEVYKNNEDLVDEIENYNFERGELESKIQQMQSVALSLEKKNKYLVEFKTKSDEKILKLKKREIEFEKLVRSNYSFLG